VAIAESGRDLGSTADRELLRRTADLAADFLATLDTRPIPARVDFRSSCEAFDAPLPEDPVAPLTVLEELARDAEPGLSGMQSGRYLAFVIGGALPAALAADWLVSAWDQNTGLAEPTPATAAIETIAGKWTLDLLGLPPGSSYAFVTGCQMAHVTALAAARHHVLAAAGWDLNARGLAEAPPLQVVLGEKRHVTVTRALRLLGIGSEQEVVVPADDHGRMRVDLLGGMIDPGRPTIVCAQAGEVNTGSFDDLTRVIETAREVGAWVHVDGAFGLWAAASPALRPLLAGHDLADSWATDAHKWLNVPYDCGIAICAHPAAHTAALEYAAPYLAISAASVARDPMAFTPEFSRRARGVPVYAALRSLGRSGVAELVDGCCAHARTIGAALAQLPGCTLLNEIVLNQVLVRFADDEATRAVLEAVLADGEAQPSPSVWEGRAAIRISVSNWRTNESDVQRIVASFRRAVA
jgi:glutamate/tyrosine decarboxylase-like PLP-dependent enzyme